MARVATKLIEGFRRRAHSVDVIASERMPRVAWRDIRVPLLPLQWRSFLRRARDADVISLHGPVPGFSDVILALSRIQSMPPIAYTHHMDIRFRQGRAITNVYGSLYRKIARSAAGVTIVSTCATARAFGGANTRVVPFGVEHEGVRRDITRGEPFSVLFVGQLRPYKGVDVLLRAMTALPGVRLTIAGRGYADSNLRRLAADLRLSNVEFVGSPGDDALWQLYARNHIFVQPSTEMEYFGLASLEAMASGCVPVITDLPGPAEVIGAAGRIVPAGNVQALADAIATLRDDPALMEELSGAARARAAGFTWERCVEGHINAYETLLR